MRTTKYADQLQDPARISFGADDEGQLERLLFKQGKEAGKEGYRFSWWKGNKLTPRPLDCTDEEFLNLFRDAMQRQLFPPHILNELRTILGNK